MTFLHLHFRVPTTFYSPSFYSAHFYSATFYSVFISTHFHSSFILLWSFCTFTWGSHHILFCYFLLHCDLFTPTLECTHHFLFCQFSLHFYSANFYFCIFIPLWSFCTNTLGSPPLRVSWQYLFCFFYSTVIFLHLHMKVPTTWGFSSTFYADNFYSTFLFCCDIIALTLESPHHFLFCFFLIVMTFLHLQLSWGSPGNTICNAY